MGLPAPTGGAVFLAFFSTVIKPSISADACIGACVDATPALTFAFAFLLLFLALQVLHDLLLYVLKIKTLCINPIKT